MIRKIVSLLVCAVLVCPMLANAENANAELTLTYPQGGLAPQAVFTVDELPHDKGSAEIFADDDSLGERCDQAAAYLRQGMLENQTEITVPVNLSDIISAGEFGIWWEMFLRDNSDLLLDRTKRFSIAYNSSMFRIPVNYLFDTSELTAKRAEMNAKIDALADEIKDHGLTRVDDISLYIHEYLTQNVSYQTDAFTATDYSAYGAFVLGECVCQGYAEAAKIVLDRFEIPNILTSSDAANHIWNTILVDGKWYNMDITWDDPVFNLDKKPVASPEGYSSHDHFMTSDENAKTVYETEDFLTDRLDYVKFNENYGISCDSERYMSRCATNSIYLAAVYLKDRGCWNINTKNPNGGTVGYNLYYTKLADNDLGIGDAAVDGGRVKVYVRCHTRGISGVSAFVKSYTDSGLQKVSKSAVSASGLNSDIVRLSIDANIAANTRGAVYLWNENTLMPYCTAAEIN